MHWPMWSDAVTYASGGSKGDRQGDTAAHSASGSSRVWGGDVIQNGVAFLTALIMTPVPPDLLTEAQRNKI